MRRERVKRTLIVSLAVALLAVGGIVPAIALAEDGNSSSQVTEQKPVSVGASSYATIKQALESKAEGDVTIELTGDLTENVEIPADRVVTIDLGGHKITNDGTSHTIVNKGTLTIVGTGTVDNTVHGRGALVNYGIAYVNGGTYMRSKEAGSSSDNNGGNSWYTVKNYNQMTVGAADGSSSVVIENDGKYSSCFANGYQNASDKTNAEAITGTVSPTLTINAGVTVSGGINSVKNDDYAVLTINGGAFENYNQCSLQNHSTATINGGTFEGSVYVVYNCGCDATADKGVLTITDGTFVNTAKDGFAIAAVSTADTATVSISGGTFTGAFGKSASPTDKFSITGGTFSVNPPASYLAPLYAATENADGTWTVVMHEHAAADGAAWVTDATSHWHVCGVEDCTQVVDKADHTFEWVIDKLPTGTSEGSRHQECSVCGYRRASESIAKLPNQVTDETAGTTGGANAQGAELDATQTISLAQQANEVSQAVQEATVSGGSASLGGVTVDVEGNQDFVDLVNGATADDKVSTVLTVTATPVDRADATADADRVDQAKSSNETATYLDLSVSMTVTVSDANGDNVKTATADVTSLSKPVTVTVTAPEGTDLSGFVRVARVHDGVVDILPCTVDAEAGTVTFSTDRFSTYALLTSETAEVTFVLGNGQDPVVKEFGPGETIVPPADPAREGYEFAGWFLTVAADGSLSDELAEGTVVEGPMTVYAGWVPAGAPGQQPATPESSSIPKTGDVTSFVPAAVAAAAGITTLAGAVALRRRQR